MFALHSNERKPSGQKADNFSVTFSLSFSVSEQETKSCLARHADQTVLQEMDEACGRENFPSRFLRQTLLHFLHPKFRWSGGKEGSKKGGGGGVSV